MDSNLKREALYLSISKSMESAAELTWGMDDCGMWCGDIFKEALGYDPVERFRGRYKTRIGAKRVLGSGGLPAAIRAISRKYGWHHIKEGDEQSGDIGIVEINGVPSTVICRAPGWFIGRNDFGWTALQSSAVRVMWSVI
jgi:hypothetical protein